MGDELDQELRVICKKDNEKLYNLSEKSSIRDDKKLTDGIDLSDTNLSETQN